MLLKAYQYLAAQRPVVFAGPDGARLQFLRRPLTELWSESFDERAERLEAFIDELRRRSQLPDREG